MTGIGRTASCWLIYGLLWAAAVAYLAARGADWTFPIASLLLFGGLASGIAWALTRRSAAPEVPVARPPLWWRTRSLLLVVLLHGAIDVLPNLPEFLEHFAL